jgi:PAS domain S-box-containing protein
VVAGGKSRQAASRTASAPDRYQVLFDQASDAIVTFADGSIDAANQAAEELTGFMRDELQGSPLSVLAPDPRHHHVPGRARALTPEMLATPGTYEDVAVVRKDGFVRLVDVSVRVAASAADSSDGTLAIALFRDVTEKKQMERELITKHSELKNAYFQLEKKNAEGQSMQEMLVQAGKMAALGELSAGIAHELNQPLQAIRGYAQELQSGALPAEMGLREIISNVDKMSKIIHHLRAFIRKSGEGYEMVDVHLPIDEAFKMLSRQLETRGIRVERDFGKGVGAVYANPVQLEQVFINLASNARDAIEATGRGSGTISVATREIDGFVEIRFRDDGAGMSPQTKSKAFNPFFTTKEVGKGMGLGLSLSYGMIGKLHGSIVVESEIGKGAAFLIRIPRDFREIA